ncbi:hypothetical protein BT96DRAFT_993645 [Gymnopus androsaceus JB14]|uniref:Uncharacterized protein n=1 Tax=Gymnopus androsaceus JB14 TaxID=1447944 RepID=A0A6A4HP20_9AGAR|nr:hypothetical protein BT96DRAFT_993645 [Gymnopus androsaceus JB14]
MMKKRVRTKILSFVPNVQLLQLLFLVWTYTPCSAWSFVNDIEYGNDPIAACQAKFVKVGLSTNNFRAYVGMIEDEVEGFLSSDASFSTYQSNDITARSSFESVKALSEITILAASRTLQGSKPIERMYVAEALYQEQVKHFGVNGEPGKFRPLAYEDLRNLPSWTMSSEKPSAYTLRSTASCAQFATISPFRLLLLLPSPNSKSEGITKKATSSSLHPSLPKWTLRYGRTRTSGSLRGGMTPRCSDDGVEGGCRLELGGIGVLFAYLQLGTILSTLLRKMEFKLPTGVPEHNYHTITMSKTPRDVHYRRAQFD